ncbi:hypothetical protein [Curvivirga aplysinae]|uniref:hypothetical protein n=1 Tax=Curvivirga aplysinae TaxID=2529852 RepID=UPI0012BB81F5|nr:hypothetical protein [Curvivirga aplysinae]MTI09008.1 hypothetical protein [Curvivirga aplysinae]
MAKKKISKASRAASDKLKGEQTAKGQETAADIGSHSAKKQSFLDNPIGPGLRLTWKAVFLFMFICLLLDIGLFVLFHLGLDSCYAVLCLWSEQQISLPQ